MAGNINALGIIAVVVVTAILVGPRLRKPIERGRGLAGVLWSFLCVLVWSVLGGPFYLSHDGYPVFQWLLPSICVGLQVAVIPKRNPRLVFAILTVAAAILLSRHFVYIVHQPDYTGRPTLQRSFCEVKNHLLLEGVQHNLEDADNDPNTVFAAGWFVESPLFDLLPPDEREDLADHTVIIQSWWHSFLTGIHGIETERGDRRVWQPGGRFEDVIEGLEFRSPEE